SACSQWTGRGCGVVDHVLDGPPHPGWADLGPPATDTDGPLPICAIRRDCRWFTQRGAAACAVCPTIVADAGGTATYRSEADTAGDVTSG
ncbi:hypothetical protein ACWEQL_41525, partial [Kitasatospora sp. NPDC004240]